MKCKQCQSPFEVTDSDREFYGRISPVFGGKKYSIPEPTLCSECRSRRRMSFRNERSLYKRKCSKTNNNIISTFRPDTSFSVYSPEIWYGGDWDPLEYGRDYDFNKTFFEQFSELQKKVPRLSLISSNNINCDYCNTVGDCKNCYMIFGSIECEDCMYGNPFRCKSCVDILISRDCEICYECIDCERLYNCMYCQNCSNSSDLEYCFDVDGSSNCFLCAGLKKAEYSILNKRYTKEEYLNKKKELKSMNPAKLFMELQKLKLSTPVKSVFGFNNENLLGDHVFNSSNCRNLYYSNNCEEVNYGYQLLDEHHCMDCDFGEKGEFLYEVSGHYKANSLFFSVFCWDAVSDLYYCLDCTKNTKNCFGCISLLHKEYCILNKQYTKAEYEKLLPKIIDQMTANKEWGELFPLSSSSYAYNETVANEFFPLTKQEVLSRGWQWADRQEPDYGNNKIIPAEKLPDKISDIPDDVLNWGIRCEATGRAFKIQPQELRFYRRFNLPIPHLHPDERHKRRLALRNPRKLFDRKCDKCQTKIKTTYAPDRPNKVYCEQCYLKEVY